jgi:hypothetical protein
MVSSLRGANTLFQGQQINAQTHREERTEIEERTHKKETQDRSPEEITEPITEERSKERCYTSLFTTSVIVITISF